MDISPDSRFCPVRREQLRDAAHDPGQESRVYPPGASGRGALACRAGLWAGMAMVLGLRSEPYADWIVRCLRSARGYRASRRKTRERMDECAIHRDQSVCGVSLVERELPPRTSPLSLGAVPCAPRPEALASRSVPQPR